MRRRLAILLLALLGSLCAGIFVTPSTANAIGLDCKESPTPEVPGRGLTGFFQSEPNPLPPQENPFTPNARTTVYEQYGYAGLRWTTYDLGCGPDSARAPDATAGTAVANWLFLIPKAAVAFTNAVVEVTFRPSFLGEFDPLVRDVSDTLYRVLFVNWVPIVLVATGALLIWRARRADLATSTAAVGWALFVLVVATALFRWPVEAGRAADASITTTLSAANGGINAPGGSPTTAARTAASNTHEMLLYQSWLAGTFGQSNSDTARIYGPQIFDATALTWREAQVLRQDLARGKTIVDDKKAKFARVAESVKNADPDAYEYLTGKRSETRVGYALLAIVGALFALPFLLGAALIVLASFLVIRFAVMLFPAFATLALFPSMRRVVVAAGSLAAAALINGVIFAVAMIIVLRAIDLLLDPSSALPRWLSLTLMLLVSIVMWLVLRPVRRLGSLVMSTRPATGAMETAESGASHGRHARRGDPASEGEASTASGPLRSETHTIPESIPTASLPRRPDQAGPSPAPTHSGTTDAGSPPPSDAWSREAPRPAASPSANGRKPAPDMASDTPGNRETAARPRVAAAHPEGRPAIAQTYPAVVATNGAGRSTARGTADEIGGPVYVPGHASWLSNGHGGEADPVQSDDEGASSVYRPAGRVRAPTRPGD